MRWEDKRYNDACTESQMGLGKNLGKGKNMTLVTHRCVDNSNRTSQCPSNYVTWKDEDQFWLPGFHVDNALELVCIKIMFSLFE